jgi:hypothetical protein
MSPEEFDVAMEKLQAKLTPEEQEIIAVTFAGAQVHKTGWYMVLAFLLGLGGGLALYGLWWGH